MLLNYVLDSAILRLFAVAAVGLCAGVAVGSFVSYLYHMLKTSRYVDKRSERLANGLSAAADQPAGSDEQGLQKKPLHQLKKPLLKGLSLCSWCQKNTYGRSLLALLDTAGFVRPNAKRSSIANIDSLAAASSADVINISTDNDCESYLQWWLLVSMVVAAMALVLFTSLLMALIAVGLVCAGSYAYLHQCAEKRKQALRAALPDMLDELAQSLRAGRSFAQSLSFVLQAQASDSSLKALLARLDADIRLGRNLSDSLICLAKSTGLTELKSIAATVDITARVGGSAPSLFEQTATSIRQDLMLNKKLLVQTAQGRSSVRLVGAVPFLLIGLMSIIMPGYLGQWLASAGGQMLFALAMCMVFAGFMWVRKVVNIYV